jgi:hypothetical protein
MKKYEIHEIGLDDACAVKRSNLGASSYWHFMIWVTSVVIVVIIDSYLLGGTFGSYTSNYWTLRPVS